MSTVCRRISNIGIVIVILIPSFFVYIGVVNLFIFMLPIPIVVEYIATGKCTNTTQIINMLDIDLIKTMKSVLYT